MALTAFFILSFALGVGLPLSFFLIRRSVMQQRVRVVVSILMSIKLLNKIDIDDLFPSLEFAKYKYLIDPHNIPNNTDVKKISDYYKPFAWIVSILQFYMVITVIFYIFFDWLFYQHLLGCYFLQFGLPTCNQWVSFFKILSIEWLPLINWSVLGPFKQILPLSALAAFIGALIAGSETLYRELENFHMAPLSFIEFSKNIFRSIMVSVLSVFLVASVLKGLDGQIYNAPVTAAAILLSFSIGFFPGVAERMIFSNSTLKNWKTQNNTIFQAAQSTPVEIIDGIDSQIREALEDHYIFSVQNLAAANPIMLFVETPFGIYQLMDWVAQAQLCVSVGPEDLIKFWALGIRTIFDLQRAIDKSGPQYNSKMLDKIAAILIRGKAKEAEVVANIQARLNDPYIIRLRKIQAFI